MVSSAPGSAWATSSHWQDTTITPHSSSSLHDLPHRRDHLLAAGDHARVVPREQGDPAAQLDGGEPHVEALVGLGVRQREPQGESDAVAEDADAPSHGGRAWRRRGCRRRLTGRRLTRRRGSARRHGRLVGRRTGRGRGRRRRAARSGPSTCSASVRCAGRTSVTTRHPTSPRAPAPSHVGGTRRARTGISTRRVDRTARATDTAVATANTPTRRRGRRGARRRTPASG